MRETSMTFFGGIPYDIFFNLSYEQEGTGLV